MVKERSGFRRAIYSILCGLGAGIIISNFLVCKVTVEGVSMNPTYQSGDTLFINRLAKPERGDIITFSRNDKNYIKRVIGLPGDNVSIRDSKVYINGDVIEEGYINEKTFDGGLLEDNICRLSEGEYFVMGDNRNYSIDSRKFGVVYEDEILGIKLIDLDR
ncbi:signal peptidase I [Clostridium baratii]